MGGAVETEESSKSEVLWWEPQGMTRNITWVAQSIECKAGRLAVGFQGIDRAVGTAAMTA